MGGASSRSLRIQAGTDINDIASCRRVEMADLLVRGIDDELVRALKERAGIHGRSAEAEHREILASALQRPRRKSFAQVLAAMPDVGLDADFERAEAIEKPSRVFD
jgi:plasmid stability protein